MREYRLVVDPDGTVRSCDSLAERRAVFGFERVTFYKLQAGVTVLAQRPDWAVRASPRQALLSGRVFEGVEVAQSVEFFVGASAGYTRRIKLRNAGTSPLTLRLLDVSDPTASQLGEPSAKWGALGVNAFSRGSHVAMDEISDLPSARVVGSMPPPKKVFMTTERARVRDVVAAGDLGDPTAGMSGQVMVAAMHEFELQPSEAREVTYASIYNPSKLEEALSDFGRLQGGSAKAPRRDGAHIAASSPAVTDASAWAFASLEGARYECGTLDLAESLRGLTYADKVAAAVAIDSMKKAVRKDGALPHGADPAAPGLLETAVSLQAVAAYLLLSRDKKLSRTLYPFVKKLASFLMAESKDFSFRPARDRPQGWRRALGPGYPAGEIPEISLAASGGLEGAAQVARQVSRSDDSGRFRERAEMVAETVRRRLLDERGALSLCLEPSGRLRTDETADMAVAAYRRAFRASAEQAAAHRLLEKDFETPYGPRTVPTSNRLYFNPSYGQGQLGGFWTRAALAHAVLCYRVGMAGIGSLSLERTARLAVEEIVRLGGSPGTFPMWVDVEAKEARGEWGDTVSAARFIEGVIEGEVGVQCGPGGVSVNPPASSGMKWVLVHDVWLGETATIFVGRGGGKARAFAAGARLEVASGERYLKAELLEVLARGVHAVSLHGPGQVVCVGNSSASPVKASVALVPKAAELARRLTTPMEEYDPQSGTWTKVGTLRVLPTMPLEVALGPGDWKALRISTT